MWRIHESSPEDESDIHTKNNECVLHRQIEHEFGLLFNTYYTSDADLMDYIFVCLHFEYFKVVQG